MIALMVNARDAALAEWETELKHDIELALEAWKARAPEIIRERAEHVRRSLLRLADRLDELEL